MFLSRNKKNNIYPVNPSFTIQKWGLRGSKLYRHVFVMVPEIWFFRKETLNVAVSKAFSVNDLYYIHSMRYGPFCEVRALNTSSTGVSLISILLSPEASLDSVIANWKKLIRLQRRSLWCEFSYFRTFIFYHYNAWKISTNVDLGNKEQNRTKIRV